MRADAAPPLGGGVAARIYSAGLPHSLYLNSLNTSPPKTAPQSKKLPPRLPPSYPPSSSSLGLLLHPQTRPKPQKIGAPKRHPYLTDCFDQRSNPPSGSPYSAAPSLRGNNPNRPVMVTPAGISPVNPVPSLVGQTAATRTNCAALPSPEISVKSCVGLLDMSPPCGLCSSLESGRARSSPQIIDKWLA